MHKSHYKALEGGEKNSRGDRKCQNIKGESLCDVGNFVEADLIPMKRNGWEQHLDAVHKGVFYSNC